MIQFKHMRLNIKINKLPNLYSFVANLAQWNELSCVPARKKEWLTRTDPLNSKEKTALKKFVQIFIHAPGSLEFIFLTNQPKNTWLQAQEMIGGVKTNELKKIFSLFENRFKKIWTVEENKLKIIARLFYKQNQKINKNVLTIMQLCGLRKRFAPKNINLTMLLNAGSEEGQGWSWTNQIILECSNWPKERINYLINCIFLHELFHFLIKKNTTIATAIKKESKKIQKYLSKDLELWQPEIILEDALVSSFLPEGYLAKKFCGIDSQKEAKKELNKKSVDDFTKLRNRVALGMHKTAKAYIENDKNIDNVYIKETIEQIKKAG